MSRLYHRQTHVPERGVVVSTVANDGVIGWNRTAETMVFSADASGEITNWTERYFESHGMLPAESDLDAWHERIVADMRDGTIAPADLADLAGREVRDA